MNVEQFKEELAKQCFPLTDCQVEQFHCYFERLVEWNEKINLTAITGKEEVYLKHFYDSITVAFSHSLSEKPYHLCDVGSGAGFPSIPLKILFPSLKVTIVDSLNKRINFLKLLVEDLGLEDVSLYHDRAETFGQNAQFRESYDFVTARAVARLNVLAELCLPLVKESGYFLAMKAMRADEEVAEAKKAISLLGGKWIEDTEIHLPETNDERHILVIQKVKKTPKKYPRKPGTPNKQPLH